MDALKFHGNFHECLNYLIGCEEIPDSINCNGARFDDEFTKVKVSIKELSVLLPKIRTFKCTKCNFMMYKNTTNAVLDEDTNIPIIECLHKLKEALTNCPICGSRIEVVANLLIEEVLYDVNNIL